MRYGRLMFSAVHILREYERAVVFFLAVPAGQGPA